MRTVFSTKRLRAAAVLSVVVFAAAACASDNSSSSAPSSGASASTAQPGSSAASGAPSSGAPSSGAATTNAFGQDLAGRTGTKGGHTSPGIPTDYDPNGQITLVYTTPGVQLDPVHILGADQNYMYPVYDRLLSVADDFSLDPMLATSWKFAPDGSYLEMNLRQDVTFHDGTPFDANAVKVNIERAQGPTTTTASLLKAVTSVQVVSPYVVRFMLNGGGADLPTALATNAGMMVSPKALADPTRDLANNPGDAGSGPYKVVAFKSGESVSYEQAQPPGQHWDKGAGLLKSFKWVYTTTGAQRINGLISGDFDVSILSGTDSAVGLQQIKGTQFKALDAHHATTEVTMLLRATRAPLDNQKFRQALEYAVDKTTIATGLFGGDCDAQNQFYTPDHWAFSPAAEAMYSYDVAKAKQLVAESGVNPSFTATYLPQYQQTAEAIQAQLKQVGITMTLLPSPATQVGPDFNAGKTDAFVTAWSSGYDPAVFLNSYYFGVTNLVPDSARPALQPAVDKADNAQLTQAQRAPLYHDIFAQLTDAAYAVPICHGHFVAMYAPKVGGIDNLLYPRNGQVDARYLYVKK